MLAPASEGSAAEKTTRLTFAMPATDMAMTTDRTVRRPTRIRSVCDGSTVPSSRAREAAEWKCSAWGMTVAPTMPTASSAADESSGPGATERSSATRSTSAMRTCHSQRADDDGEQHEDDRLEVAAAVHLQIEHDQAERRHGDRAPHERQPEEEIQGDRTTDDLGQVGHDDDDLRLRPQQDPTDAGEAPRAVLREAHPGDHAQLGREVLDHHRRAAREDDHPDEGVAVLGPGADVDPEVARVDVGDRGEQRRDEGPRRAERSPEPVLWGTARRRAASTASRCSRPWSEHGAYLLVAPTQRAAAKPSSAAIPRALRGSRPTSTARRGRRRTPRPAMGAPAPARRCARHGPAGLP